MDNCNFAHSSILGCLILEVVPRAHTSKNSTDSIETTFGNVKSAMVLWGCSGLTNVIVKTAVRLHHNYIGLASE